MVRTASPRAWPQLLPSPMRCSPAPPVIHSLPALPSVSRGRVPDFLSTTFRPPKYFLGDSGSNALGLVIAFLALDFWRSQPVTVTVPALLFPFLLCALPLLDAALAILRRVGHRNSPLKGDRSHFYDLVLARGYSPVQVALICYMVAIVFAGISWKERGMSPVEASAVSVLSFAALAVIEVRLGSLRLEQNARPPIVSARGASEKRVPAP